MTEHLDWTRHFPLFEGLDEHERRAIEREGRIVRYVAGDRILDRLSDATSVYFVRKGGVDVINYSDSGREIAFATISSGGYFGELAAIDGASRTASVIATEATDVVAISASAFVDMLRRHNSIALGVIDGLIKVVRSCDERIMNLSTLGAVQRVHAELLRMAVLDTATGSQWVIWPYPPEREIASRVSTTRETVARAVGILRKAGVVRRKGRSLYILDRDRLEKISESYAGGG